MVSPAEEAAEKVGQAGLCRRLKPAREHKIKRLNAALKRRTTRPRHNTDFFSSL